MLKKTPIHKIGRRHQERMANGGSEKVTFKIKWLANKGKSDLTGKYHKLEDAASYMFAHALPKGMYPEYRNNVNNIVFVDSIEQHERVDRTTAGKKFLIQQLVMHGELIPRLKEQWDFYIKQKNSNGESRAFRNFRTEQTRGI